MLQQQLDQIEPSAGPRLCARAHGRGRTAIIGSGALIVAAAAGVSLWLGSAATGSDRRASTTSSRSSPIQAVSHESGDAQLASSTAGMSDFGDADHGRQLFMNTCAACHGATAQGLPHQGVSLRTSKFVWDQKDESLLSFLQRGRKPGDPQTRENLVMPPRGGNPLLDDDSLRDIVAYLRVIQRDSFRTAAANVAVK